MKMCSIILMFALFMSCEKVEPGQVWHYYLDENNPYSPFIKQVVIGVQDGYVQYIQNGRDTLSCTEFYFKFGSELQEQVPYITRIPSAKIFIDYYSTLWTSKIDSLEAELAECRGVNYGK